MPLMNREELQDYIPHRPPMLLLDTVEAEDIEAGTLTATRAVKADDFYFQGHFPGHPVMPGVLIIEAMAQAAAVLVVRSLKRRADNTLLYFMAIEKSRFRNRVEPGMTLRFEVQKLRHKGSVYFFKGRALVGDVVAAEAEFTAKVVEV